MSRGRKPKIYKNIDSVIYGSQGVYFQNIVSKMHKNSLNLGNNITLLDEISKSVNKDLKVKKTIKPLSKNIEPFTIPSGWVWLTIKDVIKYTENLSIEKKFDGNKVINYVDIEAIDNTLFEIREVKPTAVANLSTRARRVLKKNYIMYSLVRPYLNNIAIIDTEVEDMIGSTGFAVFTGIEVENEYTKLWLLSDFVKDYFNHFLSGFNSPSISIGQFESLPIPVAPKQTQNEIIKFIKSITKNCEIEVNSDIFPIEIQRDILKIKESQVRCFEIEAEILAQQNLLSQLKQSILQEAIQGKLTAQWRTQHPNTQTAEQLLKQIKTEKQKLIKEKKIKKEKTLEPIEPKEIPFQLPKGWTWCRLGEIGELNRGKSKHRPRNDKQLFDDGKYPFIQTGDVSKAKYNNDLITTLNGYYSEFGLSQSKIQKKGTLCITIAANIAECGFLDFDACVPDSIVCFTSMNSEIEKYVYHYLKIAKSELEKYAPATAQKNINLGILNDLKIPLPPLAEQQAIVSRVELLLEKCTALGDEIAALNTQSKTLMKALFNETFAPK
ncbi:MAG: hypothetical protein RL757_2771 [Bacteroidota bacterium]|jgi:type I restriction enzyme S subunit